MAFRRQQQTGGGGRRWARWAGAVAIRLVFLAAAVAVALLFVGDVRQVLPQRRPAKPAPRRLPHKPTGPGWPHRRGPHYDAVSDETGLADSWPAEGPLVLWIRELGRGYSGLIPVGDCVYTQTQSLAAQSVLCLDAFDGTTIWEHRYAWPYNPAGMYPGPRATPTWHAGRIYFAGPDGELGCLHADSGRPVWTTNVNERFGGRGTDFGYACSPLVEDGKVILPVGGKGASLVALSTEDGSTLWASGEFPASYCSALPITFRGRRLVVAFLQNALALHDLHSGKLLWHDKRSTGYDEHAAAPLYDEPYLMIASPFRAGAECYRLEPAGAGEEQAAGAGPAELSGTSIWYSRKLSNDTASSVLIDGYIYGFDLRDVQAKVHRPSRGEFRCLELATGKVLWSTDRVGHATVIAVDEKLVLFSDKGELLLARAHPQQYEELARTQIFSGETCWTAPALCGGRLYLRSPSKAACVYLGDPARLDRRQRTAARAASEIPRSAPLDLTWLLGGERPYAFDPPDARELGRWYVFGLLGTLAVAAAVALAAHLAVRVRWPALALRAARATFWLVLFVCGIAGTPVYNRLWPEFVFTWPVCLFVAHQVALNAIVRNHSRARGAWRVCVSLLVMAFFLSVCVVYFLVCRRLSLAIEWIFLTGFLPSWPIALPAAYRFRRDASLWGDLLWAALSFSAYFWASGGFILWKTATL